MGGCGLETKTGIIIKISRDRGYGFILGDDEQFYFFHRIGVVSPAFNDLREGHPVEFFRVDGKKGKPRAIGVVVT